MEYNVLILHAAMTKAVFQSQIKKKNQILFITSMNEASNTFYKLTNFQTFNIVAKESKKEENFLDNLSLRRRQLSGREVKYLTRGKSREDILGEYVTRRPSPDIHASKHLPASIRSNGGFR